MVTPSPWHRTSFPYAQPPEPQARAERYHSWCCRQESSLRHRCGELKEAAASILIEFYCTLYILHVPYRDQRLIQRPFQARAYFGGLPPRLARLCSYSIGTGKREFWMHLWRMFSKRNPKEKGWLMSQRKNLSGIGGARNAGTGPGPRRAY